MAQGTATASRVLQRHIEVFNALVARDSFTIQRVLADEVRLVHSNGMVEHKAGVLEGMRTGRLLYQAVAFRDSSARVYGDSMAVVTGKSRVRGSLRGVPFDVDLTYTEAYLRRGGEWLLVTRHATRVP